ncbi:ThuA domain-containing protein [Robertkochia solimangrovi]|nr:ThuA domain-containing protein [Robertkochia solimangrovi]
MLILAEEGTIHRPFVDEAEKILDSVAWGHQFKMVKLSNTELINEEYLKDFSLIIQLDYPPYMWTESAKVAFMDYIENGQGGWLGFHHATLLGDFDGYPMWDWFSKFMGGILFENYIPNFAGALVHVEKSQHPVFSGVLGDFWIDKEEWYIYNKSPRANTIVLASVDESSYDTSTSIKMGDHPVIWSNPEMKANNIYIFMGHHPGLFRNPDYKRIFINAVLWCLQNP